MSAISWKNLFTKKILDRGREYYRDGLVKDLQFEEDSLCAEVLGSYPYEVEILFRDGKVSKMFCSCPFAADGGNCKHMAAVLFEWEATIKNGFKPDTEKTEDSIEEVIAKLPEKVVRKLLLELALNDKKLQKNIRIYQNGAITAIQKKEWAQELTSIEQRYSSFGGYIDSHRTENYVRSVINNLDRTIDPLIETELWSDALDLVLLTYDTASAAEAYDREIEIYELAEACKYYVQTILKNFDISQKRKIYQRFFSLCGEELSMDTDEFCQDCLFDLFYEPEFLQRNLAFVDEAILAADKTSDNHWLCYLIEKRTELMENLGLTKQQISDYRARFDFIPAIRKMKIRDALECGDILRAVELLKEERKLAADDRHLRREYTERLIALYDDHNFCNECKEELLAYISEYQPKDTSYLKKLKQYMTEEEWSEYLEDFLCREQDNRLRRAIMAQEKLYRRLLDELETDPFMLGIEEYEEILRTVYPEEMRDVMFSYLQTRMRYASDRAAYAGLIKKLKKMSCYPYGEEMAEQIAEEWKTRYRQRKAMLEELSRAGF